MAFDQKKGVSTAKTFAPSSSTPAVATQVNVVRLEELRSKARNPDTSLEDLHKALKDGFEWLFELQRDKENEFSSHVTPKDKDEAYKIWKEQVSNIEKYKDEEEAWGPMKKGSIKNAPQEVIKLGEEYTEKIVTSKDKDEDYKIWKEHESNIEKYKDEEEETWGPMEKGSIKKALQEVIKLGEECTEKILDDKLPKRVIKEIGIPSIESYPTLNKAFNDVKSHVLQSDKGRKFVVLEGKDRMKRTVIMQHLNNYFYGRADFDVVIFIKVADERTDDDYGDRSIILQKIAERINVEYRDGFGVSKRVSKVLENLQYLLILDGARHPITIHQILESLKIPQQRRHSKVVVTTNPFYWESSFPAETVRLEPLSLIEAWKFFREEMSSSNSADIIGEMDVVEDYLLKFMRIRDLVHLMLSYPMRIGNEDFLKQWMKDAYEIGSTKMEQFSSLEDFDSSRRGLGFLVNHKSPIRFMKAVIPEEIINGGRETTLKQVPKPIMLLTARLALRQLTLTLTYWPPKIQNIQLLARNDAEKQSIVEKIRYRNPDIYDILVETIDLNGIKNQFQREQELSDLESRLEHTTQSVYVYKRRKLFLVVDGDGDKKLDPHKVILPKKSDSENVVVFISTQSSNDSLPINVDLTIKTEDHLFPWEIFCMNVGNELPLGIQETAVKIVEKCGGHLLAIILMAKAMKHVTDVQIWEDALEKLNYHDRELIVNALFFSIIRANKIYERENVHLLRCLLALKFLDWKIKGEDELLDCWISEQLAETEEEAKSILQNLMECSLLMQFQDAQGQHIIVPENIKIVLHVFGEEILENLGIEGALFDSTISNLRVLNLPYTHMQEIYDVSANPYHKNLFLSSCDLKTLPKAIFELQHLEELSLRYWKKLLELPPLISKLENLKTLSLGGCKQLETLPPEIWELQKLEILSLKYCSKLLELPPQIAKLENLEELWLLGCKRLETLPPEIWELPNLKNLILPGTSIFPTSENQELINSYDLPHSSSIYHELSGHGKEDVPSSSSATIPDDFTMKIKVHGGLKEFEQLCQKIMQFSIRSLKNLDLSGTQITYLPKSLDSAKLQILLLGNNLTLMKIPSSFFQYVPQLTTLDMSRTSIHELPSSFYTLQNLRKFYLRYCELFEELSPEIRRLKWLVTLDLEGTLITHVPKEIQELTYLETLSLSFFNDYSSDDEVIPSGVLHELTKLKVLKIDVNSDNQWWSQNIEIILQQIYQLPKLQELDIYIPKVEFSARIRNSLSNFRFIIGDHKPRMISRLPPASEVVFNESGHSLKFVNGEDFPDQVKSILSKASAFFLDRHMKINNLTQFGLKDLKKLRLCILGECNEMRSIIDLDEDEAASDLKESFDMQFLIIFYMKELRSIIHKPIHRSPIFYELKLLALHTCRKLTTIFTIDFLDTLGNLEELVVEDCPEVTSIISGNPSSKQKTRSFLPSLKKLSLLFVPKLSSISNGVHIGKNLEELGLYHCPELKSLSPAELSIQKLKVMRAETEWWEDLQWSEEWGQEDRQRFSHIFSEFDEDLDILTQLTPYEVMTSSFNTKNDSVKSHRRAYPSSKPKRGWDKLEAAVKKEEKEKKLDGGAGLNKLFRDIPKCR